MVVLVGGEMGGEVVVVDGEVSRGEEVVGREGVMEGGGVVVEATGVVEVEATAVPPRAASST